MSCRGRAARPQSPKSRCCCPCKGRQSPASVKPSPTDDSDTDTEDQRCQADAVAWSEGGRITALASHLCRSVALGPRPSLLDGDHNYSDTTIMGKENGVWNFRSCGTHRGEFEARKAARKCSNVECSASHNRVVDGKPVCEAHAATPNRPRARIVEPEGSPGRASTYPPAQHPQTSGDATAQSAAHATGPAAGPARGIAALLANVPADQLVPSYGHRGTRHR